MTENHERRSNWLTRLTLRRRCKPDPAGLPVADPFQPTSLSAVEQVRDRLCSGEWGPGSDQRLQRVPWNLPTTFPAGAAEVHPGANGHHYPT